MKLILWLVKLQWSISVDRLTYEKLWSIDRVSNLLMGVINIFLVLLSLLHNPNWLIPLAFINVSILASSMTGNGFFHNILKNIGFKEREEILHYLKVQVRAREQIKKKRNEIECSTSTTNHSALFIFDSLESQTVHQNHENFVVFLYGNETVESH